MTKASVPLAILMKAKALLRRGWGQGSFRKVESGTLGIKYCAVGAVEAAFASELHADFDAKHEALRAVYREAGGESLITWNDTPGRKKSEVMALFTRAIERMQGAA